MNIIDVTGLKWLDTDKTLLGGTVITSEFGAVPVCIHDNYDVEYGQKLWEDAKAGKYGPIFDYVAPPEPTPEELRAAMPELSSRQFWKAAAEVGVTEDLLVSAVSDPESAAYVADTADRLMAVLDIRKATRFYRTYPLLDTLALAQGIPAEQLDALWMWASLQ